MFTCERMRDRVTSIMDPGGVRAFLVEGTQKAVLIDTCCGLGNLKEFVEKMTELPVTVVCTHGHVDHAGGTWGFQKVYLNEADWSVAEKNTTIDQRYAFVNRQYEKEQFPRELFIPQREGNFEKLEGGQTFDLGGITLLCIAVKGHTWGSMAILLKEERALILGDACNPYTFLFLKDSTDISTYMESLKALKKYWDDFDAVWFSHGEAEGPKTVIDTVLDVCGDIMNRTDDAVPLNFFGKKGLIAKKMNNGRRVDGEVGNVVYCLDKVK